jgi:molecular chaperone GrpE
MSEKDLKENKTVEEVNSENQVENKVENEEVKSKKSKKTKANKEIQALKEELEKLTEKYNEINDKYLRLAAEFDNYKKRTLKEKSDLLKYGSESVLLNLLNILDDFERAESSLKESSDIESIKQGIELINNKFREFLKQQGLKEIEAKNADFNIDYHEAISRMPSPSAELKGKVIDVVQKGYMLHDKVIRFAKVVVGE